MWVCTYMVYTTAAFCVLCDVGWGLRFLETTTPTHQPHTNHYLPSCSHEYCSCRWWERRITIIHHVVMRGCDVIWCVLTCTQYYRTTAVPTAVYAMASSPHFWAVENLLVFLLLLSRWWADELMSTQELPLEFIYGTDGRVLSYDRFELPVVHHRTYPIYVTYIHVQQYICKI